MEQPRWTAPWPEPPMVTNLEHEYEANQMPQRPPASRGPPPPRRVNALAPGRVPIAAIPPHGPPFRGPPPYGPSAMGPPPSAPPPLGPPPSGPPPSGLPPSGPPPSGPPRNEERYSWYPDIARSYEEDSHYEPSVASPALKEETPQQLTRWQRYQKHLRRRWYFYAVGLILSLAIGLPIMFLVILPAIVQKMVDSAPFPLISVSLTDPGQNSFVIGMQSALSIPGGLSVELDAANLTLQLSTPTGDDPVFATIALPSYQLRGNTTLTVPPQNVTISDSDAFVKFIHTAAVSELYSIRVNGKSTVHLGALHANINIDKTMSVPGFNMFKGFSIPQAQLLVKPEADGSNIIGNCTLPNPTVVTIELGDFVMNVQAGSLILGQATVPGLTLRPGNTTVPLRGTVDLSMMITHLEQLLQTQEAGLAEGNLTFNATMNATTYHGEHLKDFEEAFTGVVISASLPITEVVGDTLKGVLGGNATLAEVAGGLMNHFNITDLKALVPSLESGAESLLGELGHGLGYD